MSRLAPILQGFFTDKLTTQKHASPHTISAYRDTWRLLLTFARQATGTPPWKMNLSQLDHDLVTGFLRYLETEQGQQPAHPQRPAGGDPLDVPLRRAAGPRGRRGDSAGPGHRGQPGHPHRHQLAHRRRSRRAASRLRPRHLDRPA